jgi:hypothetical protein
MILLVAVKFLCKDFDCLTSQEFKKILNFQNNFSCNWDKTAYLLTKK